MKSAFKYTPGQVVGYRIDSNSSSYVAKLASGKIKLCATYHGRPFYLLDNGDTLAEDDVYCVYGKNRERKDAEVSS